MLLDCDNIKFKNNNGRTVLKQCYMTTLSNRINYFLSLKINFKAAKIEAEKYKNLVHVR